MPDGRSVYEPSKLTSTIKVLAEVTLEDFDVAIMDPAGTIVDSLTVRASNKIAALESPSDISLIDLLYNDNDLTEVSMISPVLV